MAASQANVPKIKKIVVGDQIGQGATAIVLKGSWQGSPCAIKKVHKLLRDTTPLQRDAMRVKFEEECERSIRLRHPNIVQFFGIYRPESREERTEDDDGFFPSLVMELLHCSLRDLVEPLVKDVPPPYLPMGLKLSMLCDVTRGLRYLHNHTPVILHRDLSTNNILVSSSMVAKIGDLGTIRFVDPKQQSQMSNAPGTAVFMPPEVFIKDPIYDEDIDAFSFACVCLHTFSGKWPTPTMPSVTKPGSSELVAVSEADRRIEYLDAVENESLRELLIKCLDNVRTNRPDITTVYNEMHGFLDNMPNKLPSTLDAYLTIQEKTDHIKRLENEVTIRENQIDEMQAEKSSYEFWNSLKVTQQCCPDLLERCWPSSVIELDGKVYIIAEDSSEATHTYVYDIIKGKWSQLPAPPYHKCSLVSIPDQKQLLAIGGCKKIRDTVEVSGKVFVWNEDDKKWLIKYPNMPTARFSSSSIFHELLIVAGGVTCSYPWTITSTVEILSFKKEVLQDEFSLDRTLWSKVEQLPYAVYDAIPLIIHDNLYIAGGFDKHNHGTCKIVTTSLSELLNSGNNDSSVWNRLPDMPYSSFAINHYQGHLITFTGVILGEQPAQDKPMHQFYLYNPDTEFWDYIATASEGYIWGRSINIKDDVIFIVGGTTGTIYRGKDDNLVKMCLMLIIGHRGKKIPHLAF